MYTNIFESLWMQNDRDTRNYLAEIFEVPMTGLREIRDNEVIRDGRSNEDLKVITLEKMNEYTGIQDDNIMSAWNNVIVKAHNRFNIVPMADEPKEFTVPVADIVATSTIDNNEKTNDKTKKSK